jgi:hypothetical protein
LPIVLVPINFRIAGDFIGSDNPRFESAGFHSALTKGGKIVYEKINRPLPSRILHMRSLCSEPDFEALMTQLKPRYGLWRRSWSFARSRQAQRQRKP